jgi:hypothetical protein
MREILLFEIDSDGAKIVISYTNFMTYETVINDQPSLVFYILFLYYL